jgi:HlyD family secretion protein
MRNIIRVILVIALAALIVGGVWWWTQRQAQAATSELTGSGTIEAVEVNVGPQVSGQVTQVMASEGRTVKAGDVLFALDDSTLVQQRAQAQAVIETARAQRDLLQAGARPEQLAAAQATITTTRASLAGAQAALDKLLAGATNDQIAAARTKLAQAQAQDKLAQDAYQAVLHGRSNAPQFGVLQTGLGAPEEEMRAQLKAADAQVVAAQDQLNQVLAGATSAEIRSVQGHVNQAQAQLRAAEAQYALLAAGPSREQIAAADAAVAQAEAALQPLDVQASELVIRAPTDGVILNRNVEPGEVLAPGGTAFVIGQLAMLRLTVYLPENEYGRVKLGQTAKVTVDSYPGVTFTATVIHIANQAEFTPRNVQTVEGRSTTVYAIELDVSNPDSRLKPGMPADVMFMEN